MNSLLSDIFYSTVDFLFPSRCICCNKVIPFQQNHLCEICFSRIVLLDERCEVCSGVVINGICAICSDRRFYITKNIVIAEYTGVMKEILHNYKFNKKIRLYKQLCRLSFPHIVKHRDHFDILTAVPMNSRKKWKRGFNQSELVARELADRLNIKFYTLLKEKIYSKTQKDLGFRDRFLNILDRYEMKKSNILNGEKILLVDDIFTTGATINECARILMSSGADSVYSLTLARASFKRLGH
ncbi:MAG: ComF family protein [Spirochaetota bacterium]|nr:ComF family protein [Spirochaetota bacterium]